MRIWFLLVFAAACGGGSNNLPCGIGHACVTVDLSSETPDLGGIGNPLQSLDLATNQQPADLAMPNNPPPDLATNNNPPPDLATNGGCTSYTPTSIAAMRQAGTSTCASLDGVVAIALHASTASPKLYVQDAAGGDYSGIVVGCSATSVTHPCTQQALVNAIAVGHAVAIHGRYTKSMSSGYETIYLDTLSDKGVAPSQPAPLALQPADVARGALNAARWFQRVSVTIQSSLVMYDWTPSEFVYAGGAVTCHPPYQFGFGVIPSSVTPTSPAGSACSGSTAQPAGVATPDANEILIGTDFFASGFNVTSDCRCAATLTDKLVTASSTLTGTLGGLLLYGTAFGSTGPGYQYVAPVGAGDAAFTNLM